jgi:hypothetical protein
VAELGAVAELPLLDWMNAGAIATSSDCFSIGSGCMMLDLPELLAPARTSLT